MTRQFKAVALLTASLVLTACSTNAYKNALTSSDSLTNRQKIEQKIILDLRYFCDVEMEDGKCRTPFTRMNSDVKKLLKRHSIGGIILFAQNIDTIKQTVSLTHDLQRAALKNNARIPLLITIDQEGGKVTRLPQDWSTGMAGNMAIGAVPEAVRDELAREVGKAMGQELNVLGINTNHAPVLDVNVNPKNPVINVRAFSDDPSVVARLGMEVAEGLIQAGVAPTIKHFPGHGDTYVDSHIGLPLVDHDRKTVETIDILPFRKLIDAGKAPLIMTAHIQYPALDNSLMTTKDGGRTITPATFSHKIMTGLLRDKYGYQGVTVTDALNMHAITKIADPQEAVAATFAAGVDLAMMPISIRSREDINNFTDFIDAVAAKVTFDEALDESVNRILSLKKDLDILGYAAKPLRKKRATAKALFGRDDHRAVEEKLARHSVTLLKAADNEFISADKQVLVIMPNDKLASAFQGAFHKRFGNKVKSISLGELTAATLPGLIDDADIIIAGNRTPQGSPVDLGGMADHLDGMKQDAKINILLADIYKTVSAKGKKSIFVSLGFPTDAMELIDKVDSAYALYNSKTRLDSDGVPVNASFEAFADIIAGNSEAVGQLPMQLDVKLTVGADRSDRLFGLTQDKRLGLIVNQSSLVKDGHLIDHMLDNNAKIEKLFAVEHGVRGKADAGEILADGQDAVTGLAISSLYGAKKQPTAEDLENIDMLVFDLQDIGVRYFTYLSSLHYVMEGCAATGTPLVILDRPNPNGAHIDGPILKAEHKSFVGMHPIPVLHGMTLGELGQMINGEGWLENGAVCDLTVVPMKDYRHSDTYELPVRPSPNLPNAQAVKLYPSLAFFEATNISVGRGTPFPFQVLGGTDPSFGAFSFTPVSTPGAAKSPMHMDVTLYGEDLRNSAFEGIDLSLFIAWHKKLQAQGLPLVTRTGWLSKLSGSDELAKQLDAGLSEAEIKDSWQAGLQAFKAKRRKYLLYPE